MTIKKHNIDLRTIPGVRIYRNTLQFVLLKVLYDMFPDKKAKIEYSINKGCFCNVEGVEIQDHHITAIKSRVNHYAKKDLPIKKYKVTKQEAMELLKNNSNDVYLNSLPYVDKDKLTIYELEGFYSVFYSELYTSTGIIDLFDIKKHNKGFIFYYPTRHNPEKLPEMTEQKKLQAVFDESNKWGEVLQITDVASLNKKVAEGSINDFILAGEALQDLKLGEIARQIAKQKNKFIMIAGPSSSGKTTFANRLRIHLIVNGINAKILSMDNYYINRADMVADEDGKVDLEAIEALDIDFFRKNMIDLSQGKSTLVPVFDFFTATRYPDLLPLELKEDEVLIVEGIHGLNPLTTENIDDGQVYKIYISALTTINIDNHNRFATTDTRLIRRLARDFYHRNASASRTINMWESVRSGEDRYIFPFQEQSDVIFNSALLYEHGVLRNVAEPILRKVNKNDKAYFEAQRLLDILSAFEKIDSSAIPPSSILREFIGGSCFEL